MQTYTNIHQGGQTALSTTPHQADFSDEHRAMVMYAPLVKRVLRKLYACTAMNREDMEQVGLMGLLEALRRYGPPDEEFSHYAVVRIRGAVLDELRRQDWRPRSVRQTTHRLHAAERELTQTTGSPPSAQDLCTALGVTQEEYEQLQLDDCAQEFASFDEMVSEHEDRGHWGVQASPEQKVLDRLSLQQALSALNEREQRVIQLYYEFELGLEEIAQVLGLTAARVCQINKMALKKMREFMSRNLPPHKQVVTKNVCKTVRQEDAGLLHVSTVSRRPMTT